MEIVHFMRSPFSIAFLAALVACLTPAGSGASQAAQSIYAYGVPKRDHSPAWFRTGDLAYVHRNVNDAWIVIRKSDGSTRKLLKLEGRVTQVETLEYSPDGRMLALKADFSLFLVDIATGAHSLRQSGRVRSFRLVARQPKPCGSTVRGWV